MPQPGLNVQSQRWAKAGKGIGQAETAQTDEFGDSGRSERIRPVDRRPFSTIIPGYRGVVNRRETAGVESRDCEPAPCRRSGIFEFQPEGGDRFRLGHHKYGWRAVVDQQATLKADHTTTANSRQFSMVA